MTERVAESPLRVLSYGGGTQSSGLALMSLTGELERLDAIVFADTRHQVPVTYTYVELIRNLADGAGVRSCGPRPPTSSRRLVDRRGLPGDDLDDFIDRWATCLAIAMSGGLGPSSMPECRTLENWRRTDAIDLSESRSESPVQRARPRSISQRDD